MAIVLARRSGSVSSAESPVEPPVPSDIYIATDGSDSGSGTEGSPYATLGKALSVLPDDLTSPVTIHVEDGTYAEGIELLRFRSQTENVLKITGNTTTPANVTFTSTASYDPGTGMITAGLMMAGLAVAEIEGIRINVTAADGVAVFHRATLTIDRCIVTGTLSSNGILGEHYALIYLNGNNTVSGFGSGDGIDLRLHSVCRFVVAGTLTITGPGTTGRGIHIFAHSMFYCNNASGLNITITGVQFGFQLGLNALFQHITNTGTITVDNASTPSGSFGVQCTDLSSWSTTQAVVFDRLTTGFNGNSISYVEAAGSRTLTNVGTISSGTQNTVIFLP